MVNARVKWANFLSGLGFRVFLVRENTKTPRPFGWQTEATRDPETIESWWTLYPQDNIGCITGEGLSVIDLDVHGETSGIDTWIALCEQNGTEPFATLAFRTASGGLHLIYRDPDRLVPTTAGQLGPGIDTRGVGGLIVGPGSVIDGTMYTVANDNPIATL